MHKQVTRASLGKATAVTFVLALGADAASGEAERSLSGEQVYKETCNTCHASGVANAPRLGDRKAWAPLIEEGQDVLTAHAWVGVRAMPPRGGRADLSLAEFGRATAYMVRAAGGTWEDPNEEMLERIRAEEKKRISELKAAGGSGS